MKLCRLTPVILSLFSCDAVVSAYVTRFMKLSRSEYVCECRPIHRGPAELKRNLMGSARMTISLRLACGLALASALPMLPMLAQPALAQATGTTSAQSTRIVGSVTAINGKSLTIKSDAGATTTVSVNDNARLLRTAPGVKTLAGATPIQFSDLAVGDRVLAVVALASDGSTARATTVIAMKQEDIAQKQQAEQADWQKRGIGGLVKAVDAST